MAANLNVIASLKAVSKELMSQLEDAGVPEEKRKLIVEAVENQLSPAITNLEELSAALESDIFSPEGSSGSSGRVAKTEAVQIVKKFLGKAGDNQYIDPATGEIRNHIFI